MGIDFKLQRDEFGRYDLVVGDNGDFEQEDGFDTAILVSLLTDARAPADIVKQPENRRGWMGNIESPVENRELGGLLWLIDQRRLTQETLNDARDYATKALNWFVTDGLAKAVEVTGEIVPRSGIALTIIITTLDGRTQSHYVPLWEVTGNAT
jgi:phage gp46-like protein